MTVKRFYQTIVLPDDYIINSKIGAFSNITYVQIIKCVQNGNILQFYLNVNVNSSTICDKYMNHFQITSPIITEKVKIFEIVSNVELRCEVVKNKYEYEVNKHLFAIYATKNTYNSVKDVNDYHRDSNEDNCERKRERERSQSRSRSRSYDSRRTHRDSKSYDGKHYHKDSRSRSRSRSRSYNSRRTHRDSKSYDRKRDHRSRSRDRGEDKYSRSRSPEHKRRTHYHDDLEERIRNEIRKEYEEKERQQYAHFPIPYHSNHQMMPPLHMMPPPHMMPPHHMIPPPHYGYHQQGVPMAPPGASMPPPPPFF